MAQVLKYKLSGIWKSMTIESKIILIIKQSVILSSQSVYGEENKLIIIGTGKFDCLITMVSNVGHELFPILKHN